MNVKLRMVLAVVVALVLMGSAHAYWSIFPKGFSEVENLEQAIAMAKPDGKGVILYYTRTNCTPCDRLQGTLRNDQVLWQAYSSRYVYTTVWGTSMNLNEREMYRSKYGVSGAPSFVVFDSRGEYLCTAVGGFIGRTEGMQLHELLQRNLKGPLPPATDKPRACSALSGSA